MNVMKCVLIATFLCVCVSVLPDSPNFPYRRYDRLPPINQFSIESDSDLSETAELIEEYEVFDPSRPRPKVILVIGKSPPHSKKKKHTNGNTFSSKCCLSQSTREPGRRHTSGEGQIQKKASLLSQKAERRGAGRALVAKILKIPVRFKRAAVQQRCR